MVTIGSKGTDMALIIRQGATFGPVYIRMEDPLGVKIDLAGAVVRAQLRKTALSAEKAADFVFTMLPADDQYSFFFGLTDAVTEALAAGEKPTDPASKYVWDMEIEWPDGRVDPLYYGSVAVFREVTR